MGIRQSINENPVVTTSVTGAIVLVALIFIFVQLFHHPKPGGKAPTQAFFTVDDGKTWFVDEVTKIPPITTSGGKTAYRVLVYKCGDKMFVGHMERYPQATKEKMEANITANPNAGPAIAYMMGGGGVEVKRPGDAEWVPMSKIQQYQAVVKVTCPDGGEGTPEVVPASPSAATDKDTQP